MNDEIKEIKTIGQLLDYVETEAKAKELIDYITNLQQENEKLKERCDYLQRSCDRKEEQRDEVINLLKGDDENEK